MRTVIFPVNNKGGVGKTSVLVDLVAMLGQRHRVGAIDVDRQANFAGTLMDTEELAWLPLDDYDPYEVRDVSLTDEREFIFVDSYGKLTIDVQPTRADVVAFPIGTLYERPDKIGSLDRILNGDMADDAFIVVDLPPIPHPGTILKETLVPILELAGDVNLIPLIISTPDHNIIGNGLKEIEDVIEYLIRNGVEGDSIHPLSVVNKMPFRTVVEDGRVMTTHELSYKYAEKLRELGMLHIPETEGLSPTHTASHLKDKFDYRGRRYRAIYLPATEVVDGSYALFYDREPNIGMFPHLVDLVEGHGYHMLEESFAASLYREGMKRFVNFVTSRSESRPVKNYTKRDKKYDVSEIQAEAIKELQRALSDYYFEGVPEYSGLDWASYIQEGNGSSHSISFLYPATIGVGELVDVLMDTEKELLPEMPQYKTRDEIIERMGAETFSGYGIKLGQFLKIGADKARYEREFYELEFTSLNIMRREGLDLPQYWDQVQVFLRHLNNAVS
tara:strand:+ start:1490 stop:2995 length:1506 start_codon:yes stop_codon:yes gene_type:complete